MAYELLGKNTCQIRASKEYTYLSVHIHIHTFFFLFLSHFHIILLPLPSRSRNSRDSFTWALRNRVHQPQFRHFICLLFNLSTAFLPFTAPFNPCCCFSFFYEILFFSSSSVDHTFSLADSRIWNYYSDLF